MSEAKKNPYTGLPDNLYDTFADVRVLEHPVNKEDLINHSSYPTNIQMPEGFELIFVTCTDKMVAGTQRSYYCNDTQRYIEPEPTQIRVPVYIVGRRRDKSMEDLRKRLHRQVDYSGCLQRDLHETHNKARELEEDLEKARKRIAELEAKNREG